LNKEDDFGSGFIQAHIDQNTSLSANVVELMTDKVSAFIFPTLLK